MEDQQNISKDELWAIYESLELPDSDTIKDNPDPSLDLISDDSGTPPTLQQVAAHRAIDGLIQATDALGAQIYLRELEEQGITPLRETYDLVLSQLVTSHQRSQAWDLYAHMRLVSHPNPGLHIFNTMIRACASGRSPSPERAVDLYQELQEQGLDPTAETYAHLIRACARTRRKGQPSFYSSALEFTRQMIEVGFEPGPQCLHSLLEGAKRHGDLARARWIIAHMASSQCLDSVALAHLFQTYASYKLPRTSPFRTEDASGSAASGSATMSKDATVQETAEILTTDFPGPMPQTSAEVLRQVTQIMSGVLIAQGLSPSDALQSRHLVLPELDLSQVSVYEGLRLDIFLVNSFLLAFGPHSDFQTFLATSTQLLEAVDAKPNGHTYRMRLEACEKPNNAGAGADAAKSIFEEWKRWSARQPRTVDCCTQEVWTSMIRTLARAERVEEAFQLVLDFYQQHPPRDLLAHARAQAALSETVPRPKMTLSSELYPETQSAPVVPPPPTLVHADVGLLHKRLADAEDRTLNRLKGILKVYKTAAAEAKSILRSVPSSKGRRALL